MLTSVRSLIREGKIDEAKQQARWLPNTISREEIAELFKPTTDPLCSLGHVGVWVRLYEFTWHVQCATCTEEARLKAEAERHAWQERRRLQAEAEERERQRTYRDRAPEELQQALEQIGVPSRFRQATVKRLEPLTDSLYMTGPKGTGKTHLAAAMIREIVLDRTPSHGISDLEWISAPDLLLEIRATFRDGAEQSEKGIIEQYSECRLLVLDDLGVEKTTEWSLQTLYTIIDRRYREERQTIVTSNLNLDELAEKLDDRIASRLSELCRVVVLTGPDRRVQKKK